MSSFDENEIFQLPKVAAPREIDPVQFVTALREEGFSCLRDAFDFASREYGYELRDLETVLMYNHKGELEHRSLLILRSLRGRERVALHRDPGDRLYHLHTYRKNSEIPVGSWGYGGD